MKNSFLLSSVLIFTILSCNESSGVDSKSTSTVKNPQEAIIAKPKATPHNLKLVNGKKWEISKGMRKPLKKIEELTANYSGSALVGFQLLGDKIGKQTNKLIQKCTMNGQANDELQKWLVPFIELNEGLVMSASADEGAAVLEHIKGEIRIFNSYFE